MKPPLKLIKCHSFHNKHVQGLKLHLIICSPFYPLPVPWTCGHRSLNVQRSSPATPFPHGSHDSLKVSCGTPTILLGDQLVFTVVLPTLYPHAPFSSSNSMLVLWRLGLPLCCEECWVREVLSFLFTNYYDSLWFPKKNSRCCNSIICIMRKRNLRVSYNSNIFAIVQTCPTTFFGRQSKNNPYQLMWSINAMNIFKWNFS